MTRNTASLAAAALSLLPLGQPLLLGTLGIATATTAVVLHQGAAIAQDAITYFNRGNAKSKSKDYQGAIADYNKAIAINPQYANAYSNRGNAKFELGNHQGACPDYKKAVSLGHQGTAQWLNSEGGAWCRNVR